MYYIFNYGLRMGSDAAQIINRTRFFSSWRLWLKRRDPTVEIRSTSVDDALPSATNVLYAGGKPYKLQRAQPNRLFNSAPASRKGRRSGDRERQKVAAFLPPSHNHHECWLHALSADGCWRAKRYTADAAANISSKRILARPSPSPQDFRRHALHGGAIWPTFGRLTLKILRNELLFLLHLNTTYRSTSRFRCCWIFGTHAVNLDTA